jgi:hypothetical protein
MSKNKQHPHAALIMQLARDALKTDRPQDWYEYRHGMGWLDHSHTDGLPNFNHNFEYRRIPQWEIDGLTVGDYLKNKVTQRVYEITAFDVQDGCTNHEHYLIKTENTTITGYNVFEKFDKYEPPHTININGYEVPEPLNSIKDGDNFYYPMFGGRVGCANYMQYNQHRFYLFSMGLCHATHDAAELHSLALDSFRKGGA